MLNKLLAIYGRFYPLPREDFQELYFSSERPALSYTRRKRARPLVKFLAYRLRLSAALDLLWRFTVADVAFLETVKLEARTKETRHRLHG